MSKRKSKAMVFDSAHEESKARLKHESLMQDYVDLLKEVDGLRGSLDAGKQRKLTLGAEVRFLRRRYKQLTETKNLNTMHERFINPPVPPKQIRKTKKQLFRGKEASQNGLPPVLEPKPKKKQCGRKKIIYNKKEAAGNTFLPMSDDTMALRNSICGFDLNQDNHSGGKEASLSRAPIFDLNQVSTGEEDFLGNGEAVMFEEARKALTRGINNEPQTDLKLSICRNAGEGSSRVGKRKISWQDPVALRV